MIGTTTLVWSSQHLYEAISTFEEINGVCILIYEFDSEGKIGLVQQGRVEHLTNYHIYL